MTAVTTRGMPWLCVSMRLAARRVAVRRLDDGKRPMHDARARGAFVRLVVTAIVWRHSGERTTTCVVVRAEAIECTSPAEDARSPESEVCHQSVDVPSVTITQPTTPITNASLNLPTHHQPEQPIQSARPPWTHQPITGPSHQANHKDQHRPTDPSPA